VAALLEASHTGLTCSIQIIKTTGDVMRAAPLTASAGKGVFTKEIEEAILDGRVDLAVHSLKDLPTALPPGLALVAIGEREDPRDALVARPGIGALGELPEAAVIGTSSPRRRAQLLAWRPDLRLVDLRGNVDTRLRKLVSEGLDGIVLACAGLRRLGFEDRIAEAIDPEVLLPAVGQGALGIEARGDDTDVARLAAVLNHAPTRAACCAERAFLAALGGGCAVPIAAYACATPEGLLLRAAVGSPDLGSVRRSSAVGDASDAEALGRSLAAQVREGGFGQ
jgi:hydroxymethylbilane synthase